MECPVCLEIYQTPLLLPGCGHTICRPCAELLLTEGNYLRCPECRLIYQLRKGIESLPKNVALQRTIDEHSRATARHEPMCAEHPNDAVTLYCKTCEKSICLKCYFTDNNNAKVRSLHSDHQVDTSEDAFTKELRMLHERLQSCESRRNKEKDYISALINTEQKLKDILEEKLADIEKQKNQILSSVKQTAAKLKFTLKGSVSRDQEYLQMTLQSSRDRLHDLESGVEQGQEILLKATNEGLEINEIKAIRKKLDALPEVTSGEQQSMNTFLKIEKFDTDLKNCLKDQKRALSYQTEPPRAPTLNEDRVVVSDTCVSLDLLYNQAVRVKKLTIYYKEAMYKGFSEKAWQSVDVTDFTGGVARYILKNLDKGTMYRMYVTASNDFGDSPHSNELWFRTADVDLEKRTT